MSAAVKPLYLIDTNILFQWLAAYVPRVQADNTNFQIETAQRIQRFMEQDDREVCVPDLVWTEFLGVVLHKNMDVSKDLDQLRLWFRQRESYTQQMQGLIIRRQGFFSWPRDLDSPHAAAATLTSDLELIDSPTFRWLSNGRKARLDGKAKLLDGMDAVILIYLHALARRHPDKQVVLYTADVALAKVVPRVREYHRDWFAQNTGAEVALYNRPGSATDAGRTSFQRGAA